jgi:hypothetical protein
MTEEAESGLQADPQTYHRRHRWPNMQAPNSNYRAGTNSAPWRLSAIGPLMLCGAGLVAMVASSPRAEAEPIDSTTHAMAEYIVQNGPDVVCLALDAVPSLNGVADVGARVANDGWTPVQTGRIIEVSVNFYCPGHEALLHSFLAMNGDKVTAV